ncbi:MAG: DUF4097 domain-containing protein [Candidatus Gastranaerophilales bacterium]|nr:DUF4097 domain-containing protein [Candidatus Gastranaerophilales bacterium]
MKFCLITAVSMLGVGVALALVVKVIHGGPVSLHELSDTFHAREDSSLANWGLRVMEELDEVSYDLDEDILFNNRYNVWNGDVSNRFVADRADIRKIDIEAAGCILVFEVSPDESYYIEAENVRRLQSYAEGDTLYVKTLSNTNTWNEMKERYITLYVPAEVSLDEVEIDLGAGELDLGRLTANKLSLEIGAGHLVGDGINVANKLEIEIGAGAVELQGLQAGEVEASVAVGDLALQGDITSKGDISCSMGNISLLLDGTEESYNYKIEVAAGNITIGENGYSGLASDRTIKNGADRTLEVECAMGNIDILFD